MRRLPSFNDFSPGIIGDIRIPLEILAKLAPDLDAVVAEWDVAFFNSAGNKRARSNIPATLTSTGLMSRSPLALTDAGKAVLAASDAKQAAQVFCKHLVDERNAMAVIDAVRSLSARGDPISKASLKQELEIVGIEGLSNATTDHTTLLNWMIAAGLFVRTSASAVRPDDTVMKLALGISDSERSGFADLPLNQQIFLQIFRRMAEANVNTGIKTGQAPV